jgi:hypothetical protein
LSWRHERVKAFNHKLSALEPNESARVARKGKQSSKRTPLHHTLLWL